MAVGAWDEINVTRRHSRRVIGDVMPLECIMIQRRFPLVALCIILSFAGSTHLFAAGGTSTVATKGHPVHVQAGWPDGVGELVNDPMRSSGWNSWFTEWPNDVNQYAFEVKTTGDLNRLIKELASVRSDVRQIRLSHLKEPNGLGWVTRLPKGNNIPVIFSIGDQSRINEWYKRVRKPFGVMEFTAAPIAVPPTLTIFVQNESVNLDDLKIPAGIEVARGYVPTVFHRFNTTIEQKREEEAARGEKDEGPSHAQENLDPTSQAVANEIEKFLKKQNGITK